MPDKLPFDIVDAIFSYAYPSNDFLKTCSLVCSSWRLLAQSKLFARAVVTVDGFRTLGSVTFSDLVASDHRSSLISTVTRLRIRLFQPSPPDPSLAEFVQLLAQVETIFFSNSEDRDGSTYSKVIPALFPVLQSPQLKNVHVDRGTFPLYILQACTHMQRLSWSREATVWESLEGYGTVAPLSSKDLSSIDIEAGRHEMATIAHFIAIPSGKLSTAKVTDATFRYMDAHSSYGTWYDPFTVFSNIRNLTLRFDVEFPPFRPFLDASNLSCLTKLRLITPLKPNEFSNFSQPLLRLFTWLWLFRLPFDLFDLRTVELVVLPDSELASTYRSDEKQEDWTSYLQTSIFHFCQQLPDLADVSIYTPFLVPEDAAQIFAQCQEFGLRTQYKCGPVMADFL